MHRWTYNFWFVVFELMNGYNTNFFLFWTIWEIVLDYATHQVVIDCKYAGCKDQRDWKMLQWCPKFWLLIFIFLLWGVIKNYLTSHMVGIANFTYLWRVVPGFPGIISKPSSFLCASSRSNFLPHPESSPFAEQDQEHPPHIPIPKEPSHGNIFDNTLLHMGILFLQ